jgi:hypothetical protein
LRPATATSQPAINGDQAMPKFDEEATTCKAVQPEGSPERV